VQERRRLPAVQRSQANALLCEAAKNRRLVDSDVLRRFEGAQPFLATVPQPRFQFLAQEPGEDSL
jgi:hypothetical protein